MENNPTTEYTPGQCNIGEVEIKMRLQIGYIGLVATAAFIIIAEIFQFPEKYKLLIFFPLAPRFFVISKCVDFHTFMSNKTSLLLLLLKRLLLARVCHDIELHGEQCE